MNGCSTQKRFHKGYYYSKIPRVVGSKVIPPIQTCLMCLTFLSVSKCDGKVESSPTSKDEKEKNLKDKIHSLKLARDGFLNS